MRNHIAVKFVAVLLCALTLLGTVASAAGIVALTGTNLYDKTVDQLREEHIRSSGESFAKEAARSYCSETLGSLPEEMLNQIYGNISQWNRIFDWSHFGYAIKDAEGTILESDGNLNAENAASVYSFPISGKYMYLVSLVSESELQAQEEARRAEQIKAYSDGSTDFYNAIPEEGAAVYWALFMDDANGVLFEMTFSEGLGVAFYNRSGCLVFRSFLNYGVGSEATVYEAVLQDKTGEIIYRASSPAGVGTLSFDENGCAVFTATLGDEPPQETEPEETVAQTTATVAATEATISQETEPAVSETQAILDTPAAPEEGAQEANPEDPTVYSEETVPSSASAMPEEDAPENGEDGEAGTDEGGALTAPEAPEAPEVPDAPEAPTAPETPTAPEAPTLPAETESEETEPAETEPLLINGKPLNQYDISKSNFYDGSEWMEAEYVYVPMPELTVELYVEPGALRNEAVYTVLGIVRTFRNDLFLILGGSLLLFAILAVYLCCAAGRRPKSDEVRAGGLNRLPLDLYLGLAVLGISGLAIAGVEGTEYLLRQNIQVGCAFAAGAAFVACLIFVGFCFAFVAQIKTPGGYWWRNTLCGHFIRLCVRLAVWLEAVMGTKILPFLGHGVKRVWKFAIALAVKAVRLLGRAASWMGNRVNHFLALLPLTWQWLLGGCAMFMLLMIAFNTYSTMLMLLCVLACVAIIVYGAYCFGILLESTKRMSKGDLDTKVEDKLLNGCFKEFAGDLNDLADVAVVAAKKQLKSERMKTELITNVSHDIKTPLTSIINYVDLLQKPHTDAEQEMYLEVLARQSQRLKKLIDDLMEMSKANTGNMAVDVSVVDAVESVNQALGEFADKLDKAQLFPVFRHTEESVAMMADGRLVWRVLSNLLSNAVKYAMPGTRLYIDLMTLEGKVVISLKNISRDELNVDADELMERFVRGDGSRNTEGSGLGLNIAKSLMELQKGQLQILVDGDLFKVTLIFPGV